MAFTTFTTTLFLFTLCAAHPLGSGQRRAGSDASHNLNFALRDWAHPDHHPAVALFRRTDINSTVPAVGSDEWNDRYPSGMPDVDTMPQAWKDALTNAENAGLIPNLTLSEPTEGNYPKGVNASSPEYCNAAAQCQGEGDIWDAPDGMIGISFDDGPTTNSPKLYDFLKSRNQSATHFYIGENILANPDVFMQAYGNGDAIACHTWTHPFMSSKTNEEIVTEFGWTLQIISDLTGGRVPKYWRPPYGDSDNRVRAIAIHIFGLTQVDWNHDTNDWQLPDNTGITQASIAKNMNKWLTGPKSPGLIILEHELYAATVEAFIAAYPTMKSNGWDTRSIPDLFPDNRFYQNALDDNTTVTSLNFINAGQTSIDLSSTSTSTSSSAASTSSTSIKNNTANAGLRHAAPFGGLAVLPFMLALLVIMS